MNDPEKQAQMATDAYEGVRKERDGLRASCSNFAQLIDAIVEMNGGTLEVPRKFFKDEPSSFVVIESQDDQTVRIVRPWLMEELMPQENQK